jgi:hypothetical protein
MSDHRKTKWKFFALFGKFQSQKKQKIPINFVSTAFDA